jgi:actin beta/gamma 1
MNSAIVVDLGSAFCKAGFAGEVSPKTIIPTVVGRRRQSLVRSLLLIEKYTHY